MLANPGTSVKAMPLRQLVPFGPICDPSTMLAVNILLFELAPKPLLVIKNNSLISFMLATNLVTLVSMLSHIVQSTTQHWCLLVLVCTIDFLLLCGPIGCQIYEDKSSNAQVNICVTSKHVINHETYVGIKMSPMFKSL
jgi:hypothetical protein